MVTEVQKNGTPRVRFYYNDRGHRIKKESILPIGNTTTYYVRDAAGSPLAIYENNVLTEHPIYGSSRLGVHYRQSGTEDAYQLTDHLGNVRAVIMKNGENAVSLTAKTDYYPFGMPMPGPDNVVGDYRYKFQGQEKDSETGKEAFELRLWDGRIGRWLTTDPYGQYSSPYVGMGNDPINGIDPDGGYKTKWGRFWGWAGGGFQGKFVGDGTASNPYKNYGIQKGRFLDDGQGSFGGTLELYNDYGDWKSAAAADIQADWRNAEFQEQYMTTYDSRLRAIASVFELATPSAKVKIPKNWKIFSKSPTPRNSIPNGNAANHLFEGANKLAKTPTNRQLITKIANGSPIATDKFGKIWHAKALKDGRVIYTYSQHGIVKGSGVNISGGIEGVLSRIQF